MNVMIPVMIYVAIKITEMKIEPAYKAAGISANGPKMRVHLRRGVTKFSRQLVYNVRVLSSAIVILADGNLLMFFTFVVSIVVLSLVTIISRDLYFGLS